MIELEDAVRDLARRRPAFHAEADLQHALAWRLHELHPASDIRLERPCKGQSGRIHLDIWMRAGGRRTGIELKYKTTSVGATIGGEVYELRNQSAQDTGRFAFLADLMRLEGLLETGRIDHGFALFLTNDSSYWRDTGRRDRTDEDFRLHEGRVVKGRLSWADRTAATTRSGHEGPIILSGSYEIRWQRYSEVNGSEFRFTLVEVRAGPGSQCACR